MFDEIFGNPTDLPLGERTVDTARQTLERPRSSILPGCRSPTPVCPEHAADLPQQRRDRPGCRAHTRYCGSVVMRADLGDVIVALRPADPDAPIAASVAL